MLDMGFIHDIRKIIAKLPNKRQSLFFSATMPPAIIELSRKILGHHPEKISVKPQQATAEKVEQAVYFVSKTNKPKLLIHLLQTNNVDSVLVFSRTKHGANKIVKLLDRADIKSEAIHGNKSQVARQKALGNFKNGLTKVLIATDIAARGIDVEELSLVVNFDLPNISETYVHRIGRTGRAKASGIAISFCASDERGYLRDIEKLIKQKIKVIEKHPFLSDDNEGKSTSKSKSPVSKQRPRYTKQNKGSSNNNQPNRNKSNSKRR